MIQITFTYHLTLEAVIAYSQSIEAPLQQIRDAWIAPATMPITFWKIADVPWLDPKTTYIHGKQSFAYNAPLTAGSQLDCVLTLTKVETKSGRSGNLELLTHTLTCTCKDKPILTAETVLITIGDPS
ncbi:FAS1-like dehydratase domain-containing protein [Paenibacillus glycanilyticus]|uniref:FAS1-like dehydratase domain-containing protein n=1 Tax=Paenibacillus glycanilyticus TaxID=126569 RepID=A0ABQ6GJI7_9BACL|nr:MaoC family dehydratase N-terminal domain-containing protein [Paenibacillus glycanilyticus]GLX70650.1 hypothetical protein MU1_49960 [Paenibacillus glycanilyticus]